MSNSLKSSDSAPFIGQEVLKARLLAAAEKGRVPHGLLFVGPDGIGKTTMAGYFAAVLLCSEDSKPCGVCPSCKKLAALSHPDVFVPDAGASARSIGIEAIRDFISGISRRPIEGGRKIGFLAGGLPLTEAAQNALLKTLEEPPGDTVFLLEAQTVSELLPTVVSRCMPVKVPPLSQRETEKLLLGRGVDASRARDIAARSRGIPGRAIAFAASGGDSEITGLLAGLLKGGPGVEGAEALPPLKELLPVWRRYVEGMLVSLKGGLPSALFPDISEAQISAANRLGSARLLIICHALDDAEAMLAANVGEAGIKDQLIKNITEAIK